MRWWEQVKDYPLPFALSSGDKKYTEFFIKELKTCEVFEFNSPENDDLPF